MNAFCNAEDATDAELSDELLRVRRVLRVTLKSKNQHFFTVN
jgi:hypothetical protein